jgi:hypothetical protein
LLYFTFRKEPAAGDTGGGQVVLAGTKLIELVFALEDSDVVCRNVEEPAYTSADFQAEGTRTTHIAAT